MSAGRSTTPPPRTERNPDENASPTHPSTCFTNSGSRAWPRPSRSRPPCPTSPSCPSRTASPCSSNARRPNGNNAAPAPQGTRQAPSRCHHRGPQLQGPPRAGPILVLRLASGQWFRDGQTVLVSGATGSGKSYLACAFGHQACRLGISTRYYRVSRLLDELTLARGDGSYPKLIQRLARTWLLVLDDWGLASLSGQGRHDLLEVLDDRYARRGHAPRQPGTRRTLARCRRRSHLRRRHPRPSPQQRTPDHPQGRIHEKAVRLDEEAPWRRLIRRKTELKHASASLSLPATGGEKTERGL